MSAEEEVLPEGLQDADALQWLCCCPEGREVRVGKQSLIASRHSRMRAAEDSSAPAEDGSPSGVAGDGRGDCSIHKLGLKESEKQGTSWKAMGNRSHTHHQLSVVGGRGGCLNAV